jgi:cell wall-active antibiotic response 4TMS protein YvqF
MNRERKESMSSARRSGLFWGVLLIVLGLGFLLHNFSLVPEGIFSLWPLIVMAAGLWILGEAARRGGRGLVGGVVVLALGVFWLLENYGRVSGQMFLPVLLIALGVGLLLQGLPWGRAG